MAEFINVTRMNLKSPTERDKEFRASYYKVEKPRDPANSLAIVEVFGQEKRAAHCKCCDSIAYMEDPCEHIRAVKDDLGG